LHDWRNSFLGAVFGALVGLVLGLLGFYLSLNRTTNAMGPVVFLLVPLTSGFVIAMVSRGIQRVSGAAVLATLVALVILVAARVEGVLCAILVLPLLFCGLMCGVLLGYFFLFLLKRNPDNPLFMSAVVLSMPLLILAGHRVELKTLVHPRQEIVTTTIHLAADPPAVWNELRSFDSLQGEKPWLMHLGLPVPQRCAMVGTGVGAKRTCYFDQGYIEETVTEWSPPNTMQLAIDRSNLPGRHWLEFETARYDLHPEAGGTSLTRSTTIVSNLYPSWYWRRFERWGISSEHHYIFNDLARRSPPPAPTP
jgi:hypothetical protein